MLWCGRRGTGDGRIKLCVIWNNDVSKVVHTYLLLAMMVPQYFLLAMVVPQYLVLAMMVPQYLLLAMMVPQYLVLAMMVPQYFLLAMMVPQYLVLAMMVPQYFLLAMVVPQYILYLILHVHVAMVVPNSLVPSPHLAFHPLQYRGPGIVCHEGRKKEGTKNLIECRQIIDVPNYISINNRQYT